MRYKITIVESLAGAGMPGSHDATIVYHTHDSANRSVTIHDIAHRFAAALGCYVLNVEEFVAGKPRSLPAPDPECRDSATNSPVRPPG